MELRPSVCWAQAKWASAYPHCRILAKVTHANILEPGLGIALVAALRAKVPVLICDKSTEQVDRGLKLMDKLLMKDVAKGKIQEIDAKEARDRVSVVSPEKGIAGLRDVDMVIEVRLYTTGIKTCA